MKHDRSGPQAGMTPLYRAPVATGEPATDDEIWHNDTIMAANASAGLPMAVLGMLVRATLRAFAARAAAPPIEAQAGEPMPSLTVDQIAREFSRTQTLDAEHLVMDLPDFAAGVRFAERHHGIKETDK